MSEIKRCFEVLLLIAGVSAIAVPACLIWNCPLWPFQALGAVLGALLAIWQHKR